MLKNFLKAFLLDWLPPAITRFIRKCNDVSLPLIIEYEIINSLPILAGGISDNCQGTHLNESGNSKQILNYIEEFQIIEELSNQSVIDNLFFLENFVASHLPQDATIVDIGCGIGKYGKILKREKSVTQNWKYTGVERTQEILEYAKRLCPEFDFVSSNNSVLIPLPNDSEDLVMASSMLQYTLDEWIISLQDMLRVTKKYVYISRLPIIRQYSSCFCHQRVVFNGKSEDHFFKIFNRQEFESIISELNAQILYRDYGQEIIYVNGISEPIFLNQYLISKY